MRAALPRSIPTVSRSAVCLAELRRHARCIALWPARVWIRAEISSLERWRQGLLRSEAWQEAAATSSEIEAARVTLARLEIAP